MNPDTYPLRLSARDAAGHDAGRIHAARLTPPDDCAACERLRGFPVALCGAPFGRNGTVTHSIGPTCKRCRAELAR